MTFWIRIQMREQKKLVGRDQSINAERERERNRKRQRPTEGLEV